MKSTRPPVLLALALGCAAPHLARAESLPAGPLPPEQRWNQDVLVLRNSQLEVVLAPAVGRVASVRYEGGRNLLRFDEDLSARAAAGDADGGWRNFGGDWMMTSVQSNWPGWFGAAWPPIPAMDGEPWRGHAWTADDGAQHALLEREAGAPLHLQITRAFRLDPAATTLSIRQRIEALADTTVPVTLWNITQLVQPDRLFLPISKKSVFAEGYGILDFGPPPTHLLHRTTPGVLSLDTAGTSEHKLGSDAPEGWIAAQCGEILVIERAATREPGGIFPDGGCRVELYVNAGLGYAEIETLSEERLLRAGETMENVLTLDVSRLKPALDAAAAAKALQERLESQPATAH